MDLVQLVLVCSAEEQVGVWAQGSTPDDAALQAQWEKGARKAGLGLDTGGVGGLPCD